VHSAAASVSFLAARFCGIWARDSMLTGNGAKMLALFAEALDGAGGGDRAAAALVRLRKPAFDVREIAGGKLRRGRTWTVGQQGLPKPVRAVKVGSRSSGRADRVRAHHPQACRLPNSSGQRKSLLWRRGLDTGWTPGLSNVIPHYGGSLRGFTRHYSRSTARAASRRSTRWCPVCVRNGRPTAIFELSGQDARFGFETYKPRLSGHRASTGSASAVGDEVRVSTSGPARSGWRSGRHLPTGSSNRGPFVRARAEAEEGAKALRKQRVFVLPVLRDCA